MLYDLCMFPQTELPVAKRVCVFSRVLIDKPIRFGSNIREKWVPHLRHLEKPDENNSLAGFEGLVAKDSSWWCDGRTVSLSRGVTYSN